MPRKTDKYANYVEHPRYGRGPLITGLNPQGHERGVNLHWNTLRYENDRLIRSEAVIANTAIAADLTRQIPATVPVTHYYDLEHQCRDCGRPFIFFAAEQKHWYEELGFKLEADCVRCTDCRKHEQGIARQRETYEALFHVADKTVDQTLEMAEACLALIESGEFTRRQTQHVRALLNSVPEDADVRKRSRFARLQERVAAAEQNPEAR